MTHISSLGKALVVEIRVCVSGWKRDNRNEKIMSQDRKKRQLLTHTDMHTQVTPMMLLASCLKGVLREHALAPTPLLYQRHLALSQPIRMAINHTSHKHCHPCCRSGSIALSSCPGALTCLSPLDSPSVPCIQEMFFSSP